MPNPTPKAAAAKPKRKLSKRRLIIISVVAIIVLTLGVSGGIVLSIMAKTPEFKPKVLTAADQTSIIYDKDEKQIGILHAEENREVADSKEIPDMVKKAFVSIEDVRFYEHFGVDPYGIARALFKNLTGSKREGGSTITVQLARNAFLNQDQNWSRKIQEATLAIKLERLYTKDEILTFYLNRIYFGESAYGIKAAAKTYFGKDIKKEPLDIGEIAMLVGIVKGPSIYDPYINPEAAKSRRAVVLGALRDNKVISQADYDKYKDAPFTYVEKIKAENKNPQAVNQPTVKVSYSFPYFVDYAVNELEDYGISPDAIYSGGLQIYTTVDPKIQTATESAFADPKNFPKDIDGQQAEGAMVVMDPKDGSVRAMVGGRNYRTAKDFNRAWQAKRQPGSSIKPLVAYAPALEKGGYFPGTVLDDMPVSYKGGDGKTWTPTDDDGAWRGLISMRYALQQSVNVYAVKLLNKIGIEYGWKFAKEKFGLPLAEDDKVLSLALGTPEVSVLDMVSAYSAFPTGGMKPTRHAILKVVDSKGTTLVDNTNLEKKRIMSEQSAYLMEDMMRGVVTGGTGTAAQFGNWFIAGKTGTSSMSDYKRAAGTRDIWFMGYTPDYVGGVWMGFDNSSDRRNLRGYYGGGPPANLWRKIMTTAHEGLPVISKIDKPGGLSWITYDAKSGLTPSNLTPSQFIKQDYAIQGALPSGTSDVWTEMEVCADTGLLPGPNTKTKVSKVFLTVNRSGINASWPDDEAPYRPPTDTCNMAAPSQPIPDPTTTAPTINPLSELTSTYSAGNALLNLKVNGTYKLVIKVDGPGTSPPWSPPPPAQFSGDISGLSVPLPLPKKKDTYTYTISVSAVDPSDPNQKFPPLTTTLPVQVK